jgi:hypothetical protein
LDELAGGEELIMNERLAHLPRPDQHNPDLGIHQKLFYGFDAKLHPITGMVLEQGSGALPADEQARRMHIPEIARTQGRAAAMAMLRRLDGKE